jgi:hypothetical protein
MGQRRNDIDVGQPKGLEENMFQRHFLHMDWPGREPGFLGKKPAANRLSYNFTHNVQLIPSKFMTIFIKSSNYNLRICTKKNKICIILEGNKYIAFIELVEGQDLITRGFNTLKENETHSI